MTAKIKLRFRSFAFKLIAAIATLITASIGMSAAVAQDFGVSDFTSTPTILGVGAPGTFEIDVTRFSGAGSVVVTFPLGSFVERNPLVALPAGCTLTQPTAPNQIVTCTVTPTANLTPFILAIPVRGFAVGAGPTTITIPADSNAGNNSVTGTVTVQAGGDLQVNKVAHVTSAPPPMSWTGTVNIPSASLTTYTLTPRIAGTSPLNDLPSGQSITVTDTLPSAASFTYLNTTGTGAGWMCNQAGLVVTCTINGPRSAGALPDIKINGRIVASVIGDIDNQANISSSPGYTDSNGANNTQNQSATPVKINVTPGADLTAAVSLISPSPTSGRLSTTDTPTLRITGNNTGFFNAPGTVVRTAIPAGYTIGTLPAGCVNSGAGTVNMVAGTVISCTAAALNTGGNVFFDIPISKTNTAVAQTGVVFPVEVVAPSGVPDGNLANNVNSTTVDWVLPFADLGVTKAAINGPVANGTPYPVSINVTNTGVSIATYGATGTPTAFVVTDSVRNDITAVSSVAAGWTCALGATGSAGAGRRYVTCERTAGGTLAVNASLPLTFSLTASGGIVELDNTACSGSTALVNLGRSPTTGGPQPPDPGMAPEANDCASSGAGVFTTNISTTVTALKDVTDPSTAAFVAADTAGAAPTIRATSANFDNTITYRLRGTNNGAAAIDTLVISDNVSNIYLPAASGGPTGVAAMVTGGTGSCDVSVLPAITCTFPTVAAAATAEVTVTLTRPFQTGVGLQNEVILSSPRTTLTPATPGSDRNLAFVNVQGVSDVQVNSKTLNPSPIRVGQLGTFSIEVVNNGPNAASNVTVQDDFDDTKYTIIGTPTIGAGSCVLQANTPAAGFTRVLCTVTGTLARNATTTASIQVRPRLRGTAPPYNTETNLAIANTSTCERRGASTACDDGTLGNLMGTLAKDNNARQAIFDITAVSVDVFNAKNNVGGTIFGFGTQVSYLLRMQNGGTGVSRAQAIRMIDVLTPASGYAMTLSSLNSINAVAGNPATPTLVNRTPVCTQRAGIASDICGVNAAGSQVVECRVGGSSFTDNANFLDPGEETNFRLTFDVNSTPTAGIPPLGPTSISNTATICVDPSYGVDIAPGNNVASANSTMLARTDLSMTKTTVTPQPVDINQPIQYNLVLKNEGPAGTPQMRVSDVLPPNFEFFATGPNAPTISVGTFVTASGLTAQTVTCTASPPAPITVGQQQTVSCIANATGGTSLFPGSADANNTVTVSIRARAKEGIFTTPYLSNLANNATVSVGRNMTGDDISLDGVPGNNTASSNSQIRNASIGGRVFRDRDNNGVQDGTGPLQDEGIGLVTLTLSGNDLYGNMINRTVTTNNTVGANRGDYLFTDLPPGTYTIVETQPMGFVNGINTAGTANGGTVGTPTNAGQMSSTIPAIVLTSGSTGINFNFAEIPPAVVSGFVYEDRNNNGQKEPGEPAVSGVTMEISGQDSLGNTITPQTVVTDMNGFYTFSVPPSSMTGYTVRQLGQPVGLFDGKEIRGQTAAGDPPAGNVLASSSNGAGAVNYSAMGVAPGTPNPNATGTFDTITGIVVAGQEHHDNNFGEIRPAVISGTVYLDRDSNVSRGMGEPGLAGVTMTLTGTDLNGNPVTRTTTTDGSGNYTFADLLPGNYGVAQGTTNFSNTGSAVQGPNTMGSNFLNRAGNATTTAAAGAAAGGITAPVVNTIAIGPGGNSSGNNFGVVGSTIGGRVCIDEGAGAANNNGICEPGETGINMVTLTLTGLAADGVTMVSRTVTTDMTGAYSFADLPLPSAAGYTITETHPTAFLDGRQSAGTLSPTTGAVVGTASTASNTDTISGIFFNRPTAGINYDFGELRPAFVTGAVYEDANNNGIRDVGESPLPGVQVRIVGTGINGEMVDVTVSTDMLGNYTFTVPPSGAGGYTITQLTQPTGYFDGKESLGAVAGAPTVIANSSNGAGSSGYSAGGVVSGTSNIARDTISGINVSSNQTHAANNFGEIRPAQLSGSVYLDRDGNANRSVTETVGIPNIPITISGTDLNGNAVTRTSNTDMSGNYSFTDLLPGAYVVTQGAVPAYTNTGASAQGPNTPVGLGVAFLDRAGMNTTTPAVGTPSGGVTMPAVNAIRLGAGANSQGNNFGERASSISGRVCIDNGAGGGTVNNGRCEAGEAGIPGTSVTLSGTAADNTLVSITVMTDSTGAYSFVDLKLPNAMGYTITEAQPSTFVDGRQAAGTLTPFVGPDPTATIGTTNNTVGTDTITAIRFTTATNGINYDFGEFRTSSISGFVYADANVNNTRDPLTDPPLPGITVTLSGVDIDGNTITPISVMTDANGQYTFPNLRPGNYRVVETQPAFASQGANNIGTGVAGTVTNTPLDTFNVTLAENENATNFNFGELTTSISGSVYEDLNGNGVRDPGEPGIAGVPIQLTGIDINMMSVTRNVVTDSNGNYSFLGLLASNPAGYIVREVTQPAGFVDALESVGTIGGTPRGNSTVNDQFSAIVLGPADTGINYNFGEVRTGGINGGVYVDSNNDGVRNPNEPPIPGVVVTLTGTAFNGTPVSLTTMTDASGNYSFNGLLPGNYTVTETQPAGFGDGSTTAGSTGGVAAPNAIRNIPITSGAISSGNNFGERLFGISGTVYEDKNNDGIQGADEPGIPGVTITLTGRDASGNVVNVVVTTDAQGKYVFPNLPPSDAAGYTITETQPTSFIEGRATPGSGAGTANPNGNAISGVVLGGTGPAGVVNYNFGELKPASVSGSVYDDRNNNGARDTTEPGIPGTTITLTGTDDRGAMVSRTTTTDANGNYTFANLRPGNYAVTETQPNNFTDGRETIGSLGGTSTTNDRIDSIVVRSGDTGTNYNFGELSGGISGQVYVDLNNNGIRDPGEEPIAGVTITLTGTDSNGNPVTRTAVTDANGQYQIIGLPPSNSAGYTIVETQPPAYADGIARAGGVGGTVGASRISNIVFPGGSIVPGYDFGERGASIGGVVYVDTNDNGARDANEVPIAGVTITLTGTDINGNAVNRTTVTGADGSYRFDGLALPGPNGYTITQTQPGGYLDGRESIGSLGGTTPGNDTFNIRFTTPGAVGTGYNFGERIQSPGSISGQVYLDSNGDRVNNDGSGSGQTNWIVELTFIGADGRPVVIATTRTDASGNYRFDNLPPGNYTVVFRNPSNGITSGRLQNIMVGMGTTITRQDFPIDPSGVIFDNCSGRPIAGARVFISGPAGFDPNIHLTDPQMQGQTVGADGFYQIFLTPNAPGGVYTLSVVPPAGYTTTGQTPPQSTVLNATTCPIDPVPGTPCLVNPTARPVISGVCPNPFVPTLTPLPGPTFYNQILIVPGNPSPQDVLNNHIGLTALPVGNQIVLRKSSARLNVVRGELVPYTITATNTSMLTLNNVVVIDSMPPGFRYVPNSARISGPTAAVGSPTTPITPTVNGNDLAFPIARFAPRDVYTITLLLSPGVGVGEGEYVNRALVRTDIRGGALSNLADATVKIVADALFDCTDIIGKVYDDRNMNGYQDEGEPGLKGVRVVSARGITATTDSEGRYHIACAAIPQEDLGSNFVLKVDERSLPSGYRTTTDNPLVERLTRGKVMKMNFGATIHRVVRLDISDAAFESSKSEFKPEFVNRMKELMAALSERPSILRVGYLVTAKEPDSLIDSRTKAVKQTVADMWSRERKKPKTKDDRENIAQYPLDIEVEIVRNPSESQGTVNTSQAGGAK
jgi:uncharacterized repeat protein (TIGR01451 family)